MRRAIRLLGTSALALAACTDTNITGVPGDTEGVVVFASNRADANFEIYRVGGDGRGLRRLTRATDQTDLSPRVSADGRRVAWEREIGLPEGGVAVQLWVMDIDGRDARLVLDDGAENRAPAWAPDGSALYYASYITGNWDIFRLDLATGATTNLTNNPFADQHPRPSPDGSRLLFQSNRTFDFDIYVMDADGGEATNLTVSPFVDDRFADWTPDGERIVWSPFTTTFDIHEMRADGSEARALVSTSFAERRPSVSPDGRAVVFQSDRQAPFGLFVVPIGGGEAAPLIPQGAGPASTDIEPSWGAR